MYYAATLRPKVGRGPSSGPRYTSAGAFVRLSSEPSTGPRRSRLLLRVPFVNLRAVGAELRNETLIHYPERPHRSEAYAASPARSAYLPVTERFAAPILSLPMWPHLSESEIDAVCAAVRSFAGGSSVRASAPTRLTD